MAKMRFRGRFPSATPSSSSRGRRKRREWRGGPSPFPSYILTIPIPPRRSLWKRREARARPLLNSHHAQGGKKKKKREKKEGRKKGEYEHAAMRTAPSPRMRREKERKKKRRAGSTARSRRAASGWRPRKKRKKRKERKEREPVLRAGVRRRSQPAHSLKKEKERKRGGGDGERVQCSLMNPHPLSLPLHFSFPPFLYGKGKGGREEKDIPANPTCHHQELPFAPREEKRREGEASPSPHPAYCPLWSRCCLCAV